MDSLVQLAAPSQRRPPWLRIRLRTPERFHEVRRLVESQRLHTVCEEARCPNIYECWGEHGTATFMILGDVCTRRCGFCAVTTGRPAAGVDADEPRRVAEAVRTMGLRHTVITSVDRDDLADGGARHFAAVIAAVREHNPQTAIEVLTPDFRGALDALDVVLEARPEVFSHNMETVPRLYREARPGSEFDRSLALLAGAAARRDRGDYAGRVKTGLMLGLGEDDAELRVHAGAHPRRRRRDPHPGPVPAAHPRAPAGPTAGCTPTSSLRCATSRSASASRTASRGRWFVRATTPMSM